MLSLCTPISGVPLPEMKQTKASRPVARLTLHTPQVSELGSRRRRHMHICTYMEYCDGVYFVY